MKNWYRKYTSTIIQGIKSDKNITCDEKVVEYKPKSDKREVNMKYQADFRFESNSISKEQSKSFDYHFEPLSIMQNVSADSYRFLNYLVIG